MGESWKGVVNLLLLLPLLLLPLRLLGFLGAIAEPFPLTLIAVSLLVVVVAVVVVVVFVVVVVVVVVVGPAINSQHKRPKRVR